jgi:hypothetical protein
VNYSTGKSAVPFYQFSVQFHFLCFSPTGTYKDGLSPAGHVLSDHMLLGSVVATILVIVVTAQVSLHHIESTFI